MTRDQSLSNHEQRIVITTSTEKPDSESFVIPIRILTHNIRYATKAPFKGEEPWSVRCPRLCSELIFNSNPPETFICLQEVLHSQLVNIYDALNDPAGLGSHWSYIGVGRDDGEQAGEYSPIFYRPSIWRLVTSKTIWLSETPDKPSKGWDASSIRLLTCGVFEHHKTGRRVVIMSTHLDDGGAISRQNSAKMILDVIDYFTAVVHPVALLLGGDFNSPPDDQAYKTMTAASSSMQDVGEVVPKRKRYGNELTFTSFGHVDNSQKRIDFIFSAKKTNVKFGTFSVLSNRFDDGVYLSDHRAVVVDLEVDSE